MPFKHFATQIRFLSLRATLGVALCAMSIIAEAKKPDASANVWKARGRVGDASGVPLSTLQSSLTAPPVIPQQNIPDAAKFEAVFQQLGPIFQQMLMRSGGENSSDSQGSYHRRRLAALVERPDGSGGACDLSGHVAVPLLEPPPTFSSSDPQAFITWLAPAAAFVQRRTGLPASLIVAQAAQETGFGTSNQFRTNNAIFGHSCFNKGSIQNGQVVLDGLPFSWSAECNDDRPAAEGGQYLSFASRADSLLAYVGLILQQDHYSRLQTVVVNASAAGSMVSGTDAAAIIGASGYATDPGYGRKLQTIISRFDLASIDSAASSADPLGVACNSIGEIITTDASPASSTSGAVD